MLDTWFSSWLWPFATLGWPDETRELRTFYPTTIMERTSNLSPVLTMLRVLP